MSIRCKQPCNESFSCPNKLRRIFDDNKNLTRPQRVVIKISGTGYFFSASINFKDEKNSKSERTVNVE